MPVALKIDEVNLFPKPDALSPYRGTGNTKPLLLLIKKRKEERVFYKT